MDYLEYHSQAFVSSFKKQSMLMTIKGKHYFIEFPQNLFPNPNKIKDKKNIVSEVDSDTMEVLKQGFEMFDASFRKHNYLRLADFLRGYCLGKGVNLEDFKILEQFVMTECGQAALDKGVDPSTPIDREQLKKDARYFMGAVDEKALPEEVLDGIVEACIHNFEDSAIYRCDVLYCTIMNSLRYLIRKNWASNGDTSGELVSIREKEGDVEIEEKYSSSNSNQHNGWEKLYEEFLRNPDYICECLAKTRGGLGYIKIGGTNAEDYINNEFSTKNRTMWDTTSIGDHYNERRTWNRQTNRNRTKRFSRSPYRSPYRNR